MNLWIFIAGALTASLSGSLTSYGLYYLSKKSEKLERKKYLFFKLKGLTKSFVQVEILRSHSLISADYHNKMRTVEGEDGDLHENEVAILMKLSREYQITSMKIRVELEEIMAEISLYFKCLEIYDQLDLISNSKIIQSINELPDYKTYEELYRELQKYKEEIRNIVLDNWNKPLEKLTSLMKKEIIKDKV